MKQSQDLSSQVMVEVGLALAMAFFSLFVLALFSFSVTNVVNLTDNETEKNTLHKNSEHTVNISMQTNATKQTKIEEQLKEKDASLSTTVYLFVKGNYFYDELLTPININDVPKNVKVVIAVPEHLQLNELISIQKRINHPNASITNLTNDWLKAMEQLP